MSNKKYYKGSVKATNGEKLAKGIKNVLLFPVWGISMGISWGLALISGIVRKLFHFAALVGFVADCICLIIGKQDFGQFMLFMIPIGLGALFPTFIVFVVEKFADLGESISDYWGTPARHRNVQQEQEYTERITYQHNNKNKTATCVVTKEDDPETLRLVALLENMNKEK